MRPALWLLSMCIVAPIFVCRLGCSYVKLYFDDQAALKKERNKNETKEL